MRIGRTGLRFPFAGVAAVSPAGDAWKPWGLCSRAKKWCAGCGVPDYGSSVTMPCARASATRADWNAARESTTCVRAALRLSDAVMTSALPETPERKRSRACASSCSAQSQVLLGRGEFLAGRHQVEQRAAHVDGRLLGEVALAHAELLDRRLLLLDASLAAEAVEHRHREPDAPVVGAHEVLRALARGTLVDERRERRQPLGLDRLDLSLGGRDLRVGRAQVGARPHRAVGGLLLGGKRAVGRESRAANRRA